MKVASLGTLAFIALAAAGPASGADLPRKAPVYKAPPVVAAYSWTGIYIGGNAGYSWGDWHPSSNFPLFNGTTTFFPPNSSFVDTWDCASFGPFCSTRANVRGPLGGIQAGYNEQFGRWVLGVEADIQATGQDRKENGTVIYTSVSTPTCDSSGSNPCRVSVSNRWELPWFGTLRGRLGFTEDRWLLYATGGLAVGEARSHFGFSENQFENVALAAHDSVVKGGWTAGAGVEASLGNNWSVKAEYLFIDLGSRSFSAVNPTGFGPSTFVQTYHIRDNIVRLGLNLKLWAPPAPLVARY
jgi:outer membrane immunogenic protein